MAQRERLARPRSRRGRADRLVAGRVGGGRAAPRRPRPALAVAAGGERPAVGGRGSRSRGGPADISARRATAASAPAALGSRFALTLATRQTYSAVSLERASWLARRDRLRDRRPGPARSTATAATRSWSARSACRPRSTCSEGPRGERSARADRALYSRARGSGPPPPARRGSARRSPGARASIASRRRVGERVRVLERRPGAELHVQVDVAARARRGGRAACGSRPSPAGRAPAIAASIRSSSSGGGASSTSTREEPVRIRSPANTIAPATTSAAIGSKPRSPVICDQHQPDEHADRGQRVGAQVGRVALERRRVDARARAGRGSAETPRLATAENADHGDADAEVRRPAAPSTSRRVASKTMIPAPTRISMPSIAAARFSTFSCP